jgi:hypothetical protein
METYELQRTLTAKDIRAQVNLVQEVMKAVMKKDTHYGTIPGCDKPTLYKAGSEILLTTFKISIEPVVEDLSTADEARFRVLTKGYYRDGTLIGTGVGECSSNEEKYKWRKAVCDEEWNDTPEDRRREKWNKGYYDKETKKKTEPYKVKQIRTEIADVANTVLKMAKKRSQIDLTLTATAASDIFTQDIEDMPEGYAEMGNEQSKKEPVTMPQSKSKPVEAEVIPPEDGKPTESTTPICVICGGQVSAKSAEYCEKQGMAPTCYNCQQAAKKK